MSLLNILNISIEPNKKKGKTSKEDAPQTILKGLEPFKIIESDLKRTLEIFQPETTHHINSNGLLKICVDRYFAGKKKKLLESGEGINDVLMLIKSLGNLLPRDFTEDKQRMYRRIVQFMTITPEKTTDKDKG